MLEKLTERELQITELLAEGLSQNEISEKLVLSPKTVRKHLGNLYCKTYTHSMHQLVVFYYKNTLSGYLKKL